MVFHQPGRHVLHDPSKPGRSSVLVSDFWACYALLERLTEKGYGKEQFTDISRMINAEKSDIFDILAFIKLNHAPITRAKRVETRRSRIFFQYYEKLQAFLDFVLSQYIQEGVGELDGEKLPRLLKLKYNAINDAAEELDGVPRIRCRKPHYKES